ncbi:MAG: recombinase family protein [Gemmatimonadota bacterium]
MIREAKKGPVARTERKPVGIWIRVSTEDQAKGESPEHHERRARMYAESKDWEVVRLYDLSGVSGKSVKDHPEAKAMLEDVATGRITGLIFSKLARLARNTRELLDFSEYFETHRADLVSLAESIDTSTPAGRFFYTLIAAMAQWEREEIADRVKASVRVRAQMGKPLGGAAPFGYRWEDGKLRPDPAEAPVRKHIYELFAQHRRLKTVARFMNDAGYRTRNGSQFTGTTIRRLIEDPTAKGVRRSNYTQSVGDGKHWILKPPEEWIHTEVEAVVSEELWNLCNGTIQGWRENRKPVRKVTHLFAGLTICECGGKMSVPSNSPKYICRECKNRIPVEDLEAVFREQLHGFLLSPDEVRSYFETADSTLKGKRELITTLKEEETKIRSEMDKTYRLYLDGTISSQGFGERYQPLENRLAQLGEEIPRVEGEADFLAVQYLSREEIVSEARDLYGRWDSLSPEEKRRIVEDVVERITIGGDTVSIDLLYSPAAPLTVASGAHGLRDSWPQRG